ncbi:hypothetical protein GCM10025762_58870 [Haloechinothrix salitolerans]
MRLINYLRDADESMLGTRNVTAASLVFRGRYQTLSAQVSRTRYGLPAACGHRADGRFRDGGRGLRPP